MMRGALVVVVAVALGFSSGAAHAQSKDDLALADTLFHEGVALLKRGDDATACARFAQSKELAPAVGVSLYLADCLQRVGKPASAWKEFRSAEALATQRKDKRAAIAHQRAEALAPELDRITIAAPSLDTSVLVTLDGEPVPPESWGTPMPVDPGRHVVMARSGGAQRVFEAVVDAGHTTATVTVAPFTEDRPDDKTRVAHGEPSPGVTEAEATGSATQEAPSNDTGSGRLWLSIGLAGLAAGGLGVGTGFGLAAKTARDESNAGPCNATDHCTPSGLSLRQDAINDALVSTVAFGVGVVALGACAIVTFALPHGAKSNPVTVSPAPVAGGGGALLRGAF
jgi:hypothetical protein